MECFSNTFRLKKSSPLKKSQNLKNAKFVFSENPAYLFQRQIFIPKYRKKPHPITLQISFVSSYFLKKTEPLYFVFYLSRSAKILFN